MKKILLSLVLILTFSCSSKPQATGKTEAEALYKQAKQLLDDEYYNFALDKINQLRNEHPYSFYVTSAELLQADIMFAQEDYSSATAAYLLFRDFHPKHEKIPYVLYQIGESYYKQIPKGHDKDIQSAHLSMKYFRDVVNRHPGSSYVKAAKEKITDCYNRITEKEKYIADFYFKTKKFSAARWRYLNILEKFQNDDLHNYAKKRVVESSFAMDDYQLCVEYAIKYKDEVSEDNKSEISSYIEKCQNKISLNEKG